MLKSKTFPFILHLTGVFLSDIKSIEEKSDEKILDSPVVDEVIRFDKIPEVYTGIRQWKRSTNLRCWNCDFRFENIPVFVPSALKLFENGDYEFSVVGNFCSFSCAATWILTFIHDSFQRSETMERLCLLYYSFTGKHTSYIMPAPQRTDRVQYGGEISTERFRERIVELNTINEDDKTATVAHPHERKGITVWDLCERKKMSGKMSDPSTQVRQSDDDFAGMEMMKFACLDSSTIDEF